MKKELSLINIAEEELRAMHWKNYGIIISGMKKIGIPITEKAKAEAWKNAKRIPVIEDELNPLFGNTKYIFDELEHIGERQEDN